MKDLPPVGESWQKRVHSLSFTKRAAREVTNGYCMLLHILLWMPQNSSCLRVFALCVPDIVAVSLLQWLRFWKCCQCCLVPCFHVLHETWIRICSRERSMTRKYFKIDKSPRDNFCALSQPRTESVPPGHICAMPLATWLPPASAQLKRRTQSGRVQLARVSHRTMSSPPLADPPLQNKMSKQVKTRRNRKRPSLYILVQKFVGCSSCGLLWIHVHRPLQKYMRHTCGYQWSRMIVISGLP